MADQVYRVRYHYKEDNVPQPVYDECFNTLRKLKLWVTRYSKPWIVIDSIEVSAGWLPITADDVKRMRS